jgi:hypothetical protein
MNKPLLMGTLLVMLYFPGMANPSNNYFTLKVESDNIEQKINLRILDVMGREVEAINNLSPNQTLQLGKNYLSGIYIAEVM